jgi:exopolyphosphatase/guanosine-5'-triphosphate,3'-diphosphate pyrophosphatase
VRGACIDIGSNTTRLLVAECDRGLLNEVHQAREFTQIVDGKLADGSIAPHKIEEVAQVVGRHRDHAIELGAVSVLVVATAAIRRAPNADALATAIRHACGLEVQILTGEEEARLAFVGAARTLGREPAGELGVVDVGGGSSELVVGTFPDRISWSASFAVGSGEIAASFLRSDPPSQEQLAEARGRVAGALDGLEVPRPTEAVAVGGSAASLARLAGPLLDADAFARSLRALAAEPAATVARKFGLDVRRVRLLPAGLLILQAAAELFGLPLAVARGGLREGVLLEASLA